MLLCCDRIVCTWSFYCRADVPAYIKAIPKSACTEYASRQGKACTVCTQHLCLLCFWWVDRPLMPSNKNHGSHHRRVSSCVAYNGGHAHYAVEEHNTHSDMKRNNKVRCQTWPLNWTLLSVSMHFIMSYFTPLSQQGKNNNQIYNSTSPEWGENWVRRKTRTLLIKWHQHAQCTFKIQSNHAVKCICRASVCCCLKKTLWEVWK